MRPVGTLEDADKAMETSNQEFAMAVHVAAKNIEAARAVQSRRIQNHIGPGMRAAFGAHR